MNDAYFIDKEAELRYLCLLIARDLTDNPNAAIDAAKVFVAFVEGSLTEDK